MIAAGRRLPKQQRKATRGPAATGSGTAGDAGAVRAWWATAAHRLDLPTYRDRGAIPARVRLAYAAERHADPRRETR